MWKFLEGAKKPEKAVVQSAANKRQYLREYDQNKRKRGFHENWIENNKRPWLFNDENGMKCRYCITNACPSSFVDGCKSYKLDSIVKHEKSASHLKAVSIEKARSNPPSSSIAAKSLQKLNTAAFEKLSHMFRTCHALVMNNRPITDFNWMCDLDEAKGLFIGETYRNNNKSPLAFIQAIADTQFQKSAEVLSSSKFVCVIGDGSTDSSTQEQELWFARTCTSGIIKVSFVGVHAAEKADAPSIVNGLKSIVSENLHSDWNEFRQKLVAISCDGASVMTGCRSGVGTLLRKDQPSLVTIHCLAHRLELSLNDMSKTLKLYNKTVNTLLLGLYYFYHKSSLNKSMLKRSYDAMKQDTDGPLLMPVRVGGTRWIGHTHRAVTNVLGSYKYIITHLSQLTEPTERVSVDSRSKAHAFLKMLRSRDVMYFLNYLLDILTPLKRLSLTLQDRLAVIGTQHNELTSTLEVLKKYTYSDGPNLRKATKDDLSGPGNEFISARKKMTPLIIEAVEKRFSEFFQESSKNVVLATKIFNLEQWPRQSWDSLKDYGDQELQVLLDHFENVLTTAAVKSDEVEVEWTMLKKEILESDTKFKDWAAVNGVFGSRFPNILSIADLVLTMSPTSSEAERGFSQLKLIKTRLRTKLSQSLLNDLLAIKLGAPSVKAFNPTEAINLWNSSGQRSRRPNFMDNKVSEATHVYVVDDQECSSTAVHDTGVQYEDIDVEQSCDSGYGSDCEDNQECAVFERLLSFTDRD